jgi:broad specificity phosphatase PhoE
MTTIYLMRHGEAHNSRGLFYGPSPELNEQGRAQVAWTAKHFKEQGVSLDAVYASPYVRTQQTAELMAEAYGLSVTTRENLKEWDVGPYLDQPLRQFYADTHYDEDPPPRTFPPGVETLDELCVRMQGEMKKILEEQAGKTALVVSHRETCVTYLLALQGKTFETVHHVPLHQATVWKITWDKSGPQVELFCTPPPELVSTLLS